MRRYYSLLILSGVTLCLSHNKVHGQLVALNFNKQASSVIPPAPIAASFTRYITNPVGYYTGVPQIAIPLWEIKLRDFSLPISLSYHPGGIKVEDTPSNVGLGWTLMATGMISRAVKDIPDDTGGYSYLGISGAYFPIIAGSPDSHTGLLHAKNISSNANYDGIGSYDIDLTGFNGLVGSATHSLKLIKKFFGVETITQSAFEEDFYMLPMADKEPDIFYFNFAGRTGKFVFDVEGTTPKIRIYPYQDLDIQYSLSGNEISEFIVTDENGIQYTFDKKETVTTDQASNQNLNSLGYAAVSGISYNIYHRPEGRVYKTYTSSWYLSRVDTPLGDYLDFTYLPESYEIDNRGPQQTDDLNRSIGDNPNDIVNGGGYQNTLHQNTTNIGGWRLSKIENDRVKVDFDGSHLRQDLIGSSYAITGITISDKIQGTNRVKKFELEYDYFQSDLSEDIQLDATYRPGLSNFYDITLADEAPYYKRLRLKSVQELGISDNDFLPPFDFEYKDVDYTNVAADRLPHRLSFQRDFWGYYNGASSNLTLVPEMWIYPTHYSQKDSRQFSIFDKTSHTGLEHYLPGADRSTNANTIDNGLLTKIIYPTGGYTQYEYEPHEFRYESENKLGAGTRVKKITKHTDGQPDIVYDYVYKIEGSVSPGSSDVSSGSIMSFPIFGSRNTNYTFGPTINDNSENAYKKYTTRFGHPLSILGQTNGSYVGYSRVLETMSGNGTREMKYSQVATWDTENDIPVGQTNGTCTISSLAICDGFYEQTSIVDIFCGVNNNHLTASSYDFSQNPALPNTFPFPDNPNYDWQRGHLFLQKLYDESGTLVSETNYTYKNYFPEGKTEPTKVYGYKLNYHYPTLSNGLAHPSAYVFRAAKYNLLTEVAKVVDTKTETIYDRVNSSSSVVKVTTEEHESQNHSMITKLTTTDSNDNMTIVKSKYSPDYLSSADPVIDIMNNKNIIASPIETQIWKNDELIAGQLTVFNNFVIHLTQEYCLRAFIPLKRTYL